MHAEEDDDMKCSECGREIPENEVEYCKQCGAPLCPECEVNGMCPRCSELWEAEIDLADEEAEGDR